MKYKAPLVIIILEAAIVLACVGLLILTLYKGAGRVDAVVAACTLVLSVLVLLLTVPVSVWIEDAAVFKSSILGTKSLPLKEITEVSCISARGRYIFLLMTPARLMVLSSIPEGFAELRRQMCAQMADKAVSQFILPEDNVLAAKANKMKLLLVVLFIVAVAANIYLIHKMSL